MRSIGAILAAVTAYLLLPRLRWLLDVCPLPGSHIELLVLRVGDNASDALAYLSHGTLPWQWPSNAIGSTRVVPVRWLYAFEDGPPGTSETPSERAARADVVDEPADTLLGSHNVTLETLSASPPIFRARGLLPQAVLDLLLSRAAPLLEPSTVGDPSALDGNGRAKNRVVDDRRTSRSAWLHGHNDPRKTLPVARAVQRAALELLRLAPRRRLLTDVEPLLVVDYAVGQAYEPHHDFFAGGAERTTPSDAAYAPHEGGTNRFATLLIYLDAPAPPPAAAGEADGSADAPPEADGGGHTIFPFAVPSNASALDGVSFARAEGAPSCDFPNLRQRRGLMVRPQRGDVLLFYSQTPDGRLDGRTRHGACPVRHGRKAAANVWAWNDRVIYH